MADGKLTIGTYEPYPLTQHGKLTIGYYGATPPTIQGMLVIGKYVKGNLGNMFLVFSVLLCVFMRILI
jgi:hypothetical protein